ncbi:thioredoxin domain-containing protein [Mycobacterium sp.]|uniref:thioredoxin domain-containing protein n=1 Tax=Mycobacterium sp. TaxID=1785 RepID=UPI003C7464DF
MKPWLLNQGFHDLEFYFAEAVTEVAAIGSDMRWLRMAVVVGVMLTGDGFGVQLGTSAARVALEIFIEPQCSHCARLMMFHGGEIADYIYSGDLRVTHRLVTFLDNGQRVLAPR